MTPEILHRETVYSGYLKVDRLRVRLADGAVATREVEAHGDAVAILPYDAERRMALIVRLFRVPAFLRFAKLSLDEACAGMIDDGDADATARREAHEELGLALDSIDFVGRVWSSPGVSAEQVSLYLAPYTPRDRISSGGGVASEHEGITVVEKPLSELAREADAGSLTDIKLLVLLQTLRLRRPDLFPA